MLSLDEHASDARKYEIHSMYFDDLFDSCLRDNDQGVNRRYKYRIRYYDNDPNYMRLEKKEKLAERCYKDSVVISVPQFEQIMEEDYGELFWATDNRLIKEFCINCMTRGFRPKAITYYERIAYVEPVSNVRITLDTNISVGDDFEAFRQGDYFKIPIQNCYNQVLEVKFDHILPSHIRHIITNDELVRTAFSKYYLGRKQLAQRR